MSEKMKNLVPAAAMSLALVGLSGMKAYAADANIVLTPSPDTTEPPKETQEQSPVTKSSTDINSAAKGEVTDVEENGEKTGEKKNTLTVNPDGSGNNGTLNVTTTPGGTTTETTDPVTSTTTDTTENPDGSTDTTTTTTTTSTTTTTTTENTVVDGKIEGDEVTTEPTDQEKDDLKEELGDALDKEVDDGQTDPDPDSSESPAQPGETETKKPHLEELQTGAVIGADSEGKGGFTVTNTKTETGEPSKNDKGQNVTTTTTTVTFEKVVEGTPTDGAGLTQEEFGKIVDKQFGLDGVKFTTNENGEISYVDPATGANVTVRLVTNTGTSTTNTTYTIEVSQTKTVVEEMTESGTTDVGGSEGGTTVYDPVEEGKDDPAVVDRFIDTVLNAAENGTKLNGATPTKVENQDGSITVTAGDRRYDITTTETGLEANQIANVSNEHLVQLLGSDYELKDGKIVTKNGGYEVDVTTDALTGKAIVRTIKVTDLKDHESDAVNSKTDEEIAADAAQAEENAVKQAAQNAAGAGVTVNVVKENGVWTATWTTTETVGGKTITKNHTATVEATVSTETGEWTTNVKDPTHSSEQTTTNTGNASVTGETIVWNESESTDYGFIAADGTVSISTSTMTTEDSKTLTDVKQTDITDNDGKVIGKTVTGTYTDAEGKTVTRTYTFSYDQELTDDEKLALLGKTAEEIAALSTDEKAALLGSDAALKLSDLMGLTKTTWTYEDKVGTTEAAKDENQQPVTGFEVITTPGLSKNTDGTYTYVDGDSSITLTQGTDGKYSYTSQDGTTYTLEKETAQMTDSLKESILAKLQEQGYTNPTFKDDNTITATYNDQTVTVDLDAYQTLTVKKQVITTGKDTATGSEFATWADGATEEEVKAAQDKAKAEAEKKFFINLKKVIEDAQKEGKKVYYGDHELSLKDGEVAYVDELHGLQPITSGSKPSWFIIQNAINFADMEDDDLKAYLEKAQEEGTASKMGHLHLELLVGSTLTKTDENGNTTTGDCAILGEDLKLWVSPTIDGILSEDKYQTGENKKHQAGLVDNMNYEVNGNNAYYQYKRTDTDEETLDDNNNRYYGDDDPSHGKESEYQFYKVTGKVAHNLVTGSVTVTGKRGDRTITIGDDGKISNWNDAEKVLKAIQKEYTDARLVTFRNGHDTFYKVYREVAQLEAYGYLDDNANKCTWGTSEKPNARGFDLQLGNLTLVEGKVTASGGNSYNYSVDLTTKKVETETTEATGNGLTVDSVTVGVDKKVGSGDGKDLVGGYELTETKKTEDLKDGEGKWAYQGSDSTSYDSYKTWVAEEMGSFTAKSTEYKGSLGTSYTKPGSITYGDLQVGKDAAGQDSVTKVQQTVRDLVASLQSTSVQQTTNSNTTTNTEHQAPREDPPEVDIPEEDPPLVDTPDEDPPEVDVPDEEPPLVDVPEEEPPLVDVPEEEPPVVDVPDEEPPLVDVPEEEAPVVDIPDEAPPMVDMPVEAPPVVEVADPVVPLADVPQTGDNVMLRVAAAITGLFSTLGLAVLTQKKREDEEN